MADTGFLKDVQDVNKFPAKYYNENNQWKPLDREITQSELQAINTNSVTLIVPPDTDEYIRLLGINVSMDYNGTAWAGADLIIQTISSQTPLFTIPKSVVVGTSSFCKYYALPDNTDIDIGEGIEVVSKVDFTNNGSPIRIVSDYRIIEI